MWLRRNTIPYQLHMGRRFDSLTAQNSRRVRHTRSGDRRTFIQKLYQVTLGDYRYCIAGFYYQWGTPKYATDFCSHITEKLTVRRLDNSALTVVLLFEANLPCALLEIQHQAAKLGASSGPHHASGLHTRRYSGISPTVHGQCETNMRFVVHTSSPFKVHKNII